MEGRELVVQAVVGKPIRCKNDLLEEVLHRPAANTVLRHDEVTTRYWAWHTNQTEKGIGLLEADVGHQHAGGAEAHARVIAGEGIAAEAPSLGVIDTAKHPNATWDTELGCHMG